MMEMSKQASIAIKAATSLAGVDRKQLATMLGTSTQGVADKLSRGRWTADELARVAELCGYSLAIVDGNGRIVVPVLPTTSVD